MLQVGVARLSSLWPQALIQVITDAPERLATFCPKAAPVHPRARLGWERVGELFGRLHSMRSGAIAGRLLKLERAIWRCWPSLGRGMVQFKTWRRSLQVDPAEANLFAEAFFAADLVVATGGGYLTDAFRWHALKLLDTLELAAKLGIPTAMFSQGVGPVEHPDLQARMKAVLPLLDLIALRESRAGRPLLSSLGVAPQRIVDTGDDALELAYQARSGQLGTGLGVNLRMATYSHVDNDMVGLVQAVLAQTAQKYNTLLIPLPISFHDFDSDLKVMQVLFQGDQAVLHESQNLDTPQKIIAQTGRCRVVVTGSYHAAVFALAQGIPVVGLARSAYYRDKFLGLAEQFDRGCQVLSLDDGQLPEKLAANIDHAWSGAEQIRPGLLATAARYIQAAQSAYRRFYELAALKTFSHGSVLAARP